MATDGTVRLLLFSDLHLDTQFGWAPTEAARERRRGLRETLRRIVTLAAELGVDALACGGDLYEHDRFGPDTGEFLRATFGGLAPTPVVIAPGNHDWYGPASLYARLDWPSNVTVFCEDRLAPWCLVDGVTLWGAAHRAPARTPNFLDGFRPDRSGVHLALFHGSEQGGFAVQGEGKVAHAPFRAEQIPASGLHHALLGHFHTPIDGAWHTYPGNPDPLTFGEVGERAAVLVTVSADGSVQRERHRVATTQVSDVTVTLDGITHADQVLDRTRAALSGSTGFVRVTLTGEIGPDVDLRAEDLTRDRVAPQLDGIVARLGRLSVTYDFARLSEERTMRGAFVRVVLDAAELDAQQRRRVLVTGLRALDGREDLEVR